MILSADGQAALDLHRQAHETRQIFEGWGLEHYAGSIGELVARTGARSLLDYGCGKAAAWKAGLAFPGVEAVRLYDPGVQAYAERPEGKFDLVICTDVLEHVPEGDVPAVLDDLFGYAVKALLVAICCQPDHVGVANNGWDAHATVRPMDWWGERLAEARARADSAVELVAIESLL